MRVGACISRVLVYRNSRWGCICFVNLFHNILPLAPTECDVLIVCRQHNDKEWKFKEQRAKMWENIARAIRYSRPRGFNIAGASAPVVPAVPTPLTVTQFRSISMPAGFRRHPVGKTRRNARYCDVT